MNKTYYMLDFIDDKKKMDFVRDNLIYAHLHDSSLSGFDLYDIICWNKLHCEKDIYLAREGHYDTVYVRLPKHRHYWKIGEVGKSTYEDYCNNLEEELKKHDITLEDLQLLQHFSSVEYYTSPEKWEVKDNKKLTLYVEDKYSSETIVHFLMYLEDGIDRPTLKEAYDLLGKNRLCDGDTWDCGNFTIRTCYNGRTEVTMKDKSKFTEGFLNRLYHFINISEKAHKDSIWCTWVNG